MFFIISCFVISAMIFCFELYNYNIPHCKFSKKLTAEELHDLIIKEDKEIHERVLELIVEDYYEVENMRYRAILIRHFDDLYKTLKDEYIVRKAYAETYVEDKNYRASLKKFIKKLYKIKDDIIQFFSGDSELIELAEECLDSLIDNYKESGLANKQ